MKKMTNTELINALKEITMSSDNEHILNSIILFVYGESECSRIKAEKQENVEKKNIYLNYARTLDELANNAHDYLDKRGFYDEVKR